VGMLTSQGEQAMADLSARYGVSTDAVRVLLEAVRLGGGRMAQFSHPELGGSGQWMAGGMTMVGDMFNNGLRATVDGLASELAALLASTPVYAPAASPAAAGVPGPASVLTANLDAWWPAELGRPSSSGGQNDSRYAVFVQPRRLAVQSGGGPVRVHDTLDHVIGGVQQQQNGLPGTLTFTSQHGTFTVESLPLADAAPTAPTAPPTSEPTAAPSPAAAPGPAAQTAPAAATAPAAPPGPAAQTGAATPPVVQPAQAAPAGTDAEAVLATLERLGDLHQRGILTDEEFTAKKAELLARL